MSSSFASSSSSDFSVKTIVIAGIECDVYGLEELKGDKVAVIFVAHGRNNDRSSMTKYCQWLLKCIASKAKAAGKQDKELVVINLDQRNHGSRVIHPPANFSFAPAGSSSDSGNPSHAVDMYAMQTGTAQDISHLIDFVPSYLFPHEGPRRITDFFVTGFSMGGHVAWLIFRHEPRISLGIPIVGCPDYLSLLTARGASLSPPISISSSTHFPPSLLAFIATNDPISTSFSSKDPLLNPYLGKKILAISGSKDKIVPVSFTEPFFEGLEVGEGGKKELWMFDGGHVQSEGAMEHAASFVWREGLNSGDSTV